MRERGKNGHVRIPPSYDHAHRIDIEWRGHFHCHAPLVLAKLWLGIISPIPPTCSCMRQIFVHYFESDWYCFFFEMGEEKKKRHFFAKKRRKKRLEKKTEKEFQRGKECYRSLGSRKPLEFRTFKPACRSRTRKKSLLLIFFFFFLSFVCSNSKFDPRKKGIFNFAKKGEKNWTSPKKRSRFTKYTCQTRSADILCFLHFRQFSSSPFITIEMENDPGQRVKK